MAYLVNTDYHFKVLLQDKIKKEERWNKNDFFISSL